MWKGKQIRLVTSLVFASFWLAGGLCRTHATQLSPQRSPSTQEHIRQLIASLPLRSYWRGLLEHNVAGDGIRQPWMDHMRKQGVRLAILTYDFVWSREASKATDWTLVATEYFQDYDEIAPILDHQQLVMIRRDGLEQELETVALPRLKTGRWADARPETGALGCHQVCLADDEWLPVGVRSVSQFLYPPGLTPLMRAALLGQTERIEKLLSQGADVNEFGEDGSTALTYAAGWYHPDALKALITAGAGVNITGSKRGETALMAAAASDRAENLAILLKAGADPNIRDAEGETALSIARFKNNTDIVRLLQKAGARQ